MDREIPDQLGEDVAGTGEVAVAEEESGEDPLGGGGVAGHGGPMAGGEPIAGLIGQHGELFGEGFIGDAEVFEGGGPLAGLEGDGIRFAGQLVVPEDMGEEPGGDDTAEEWIGGQIEVDGMGGEGGPAGSDTEGTEGGVGIAGGELLEVEAQGTGRVFDAEAELPVPAEAGDGQAGAIGEALSGQVTGEVVEVGGFAGVGVVPGASEHVTGPGGFVRALVGW